MEISLKNLYGDIGAKRFNDLYQFADSTKNVSRATANSTCQVPLHVPCAIQAGLLKRRRSDFYSPPTVFQIFFYLEPNYYMLAIITRVGVGIKKCHFSHPFVDLVSKKLCHHYLD